MKPEIIATTAILFAIGLAASANATTSSQVAQLWENKQCQKCNLLVADADDAQQQRQQRQEQRQQRIEQRQEQLQQLPPEVRQQIQEQQQQRQEVRQERQEQRQEVRQERRDNRIEQWQQLPPDVQQERIEQWQQIPPEVRQERRDDRQDARQERRDDWLQDAWLYQEPWYYDLGSTTYTAPIQTYVTPAPGVNSIKVEMMSLTQEQATVVIEDADARQELIFTRNRTRQTVYLAPGIHKVWFKNAKGSSWMSGTLNLGKSDRIRIAFNEDRELVQVSDDPQAWTEDRRVSRQAQVR